MREYLSDLIALLKERFDHPFKFRFLFASLLALALMSVLIVRLYRLQVVESESYSESFITSIERTVRSSGARGNIFDADSNLLAYNKLSYNIVISDDGSYTDYNDRNLMLLRLANILEKHGVSVSSSFYVDIDDAGEFFFTTRSLSAKNRFIANVYGVSVSELDLADEEGVVRYPSDVSAYDLFLKKVGDYAFNAIKGEDLEAIVVSDSTMLNMVKILYTMRQTAFQKYEISTIAYGISDECMAEILENQSDLKGVDVEESYVRRYNNARYFSNIIGYTGAIQDDLTLQELQKTNSDYEISDIVGATGIEKTMESELHGKKGERRIYVDNYGQVIETISETEAGAGNDIYLTIDQNLQIGVYHLLEQQLAGILANKIVNTPVSLLETPTQSSNVVISVDDAFYQFINNNILDTSHFFNEEERGHAEEAIALAFSSHKTEVLREIYSQLTDPLSPALSELSNEYVAYMAYILDYLSGEDAGIVRTKDIDIYGDSYLSWKNDRISLRSYLYSGISEGWVDVSALEMDEAAYHDSDSIFERILSFIMDDLPNDEDFDKLVYKYMLYERNGLSGRLLSMALYEQGVLDFDSDRYALLYNGDEDYAYEFLIERIRDIDITPAQLALDPCMGSVVITDVRTGEVRALVSYPGYDNNRINDTDYFNSCLSDLSLPLINTATQTNKAPGSTIKPITAIAVLEEGVLGVDETVDCTGIYEEVTPSISCWIGEPGHGNLTVSQAIENSCNFCFADYGHLLSMTEADGEEVYSAQEGIEILSKYERMFGLDRVSGIQIEERAPQISDSDPERSAFGQGNNSFNNMQLARYTVALASSGTLFDLTLINRETDSQGTLIQEFPATVLDHIELKQSTWDAVRTGLRSVITSGVAKDVFSNWDTVEIAGKTGTAEEVKTRGNHGEFISYAPYDDPEIAVTIVIPFSYSSGNSARLARRVYDYYYGVTDLPAIVTGDAWGIEITNIVDG